MVLRISAFSHPSFIGLQRRFLASLEMTIKESHQSLILSHQSVVPRYSPLLSNFWRYPFPVSSSRAQPRDISCTAVTVTLALAEKRRLGASYSAFSHPSFIRLQRRFLALLEMTIQESHQSLVPGYSPLLSHFWRYPFPVSSSRAQPRDLSCTAVIVTLALAGKRRLGASYFYFLKPIIYPSAREISRFARNDDT